MAKIFISSSGVKRSFKNGVLRELRLDKNGRKRWVIIEISTEIVNPVEIFQNIPPFLDRFTGKIPPEQVLPALERDILLNGLISNFCRDILVAYEFNDGISRRELVAASKILAKALELLIQFDEKLKKWDA